MRTTVTLDPDVATIVKRAMSERGLSFKVAVNDAIRRGAGISAGEPPAIPTFEMGAPEVDVTKALRLSGELEDAEQAGRLARGA